MKGGWPFWLFVAVLVVVLMDGVLSGSRMVGTGSGAVSRRSIRMKIAWRLAGGTI